VDRELQPFRLHPLVLGGRLIEVCVGPWASETHGAATFLLLRRRVGLHNETLILCRHAFLIAPNLLIITNYIIYILIIIMLKNSLLLFR